MRVCDCVGGCVCVCECAGVWLVTHLNEGKPFASAMSLISLFTRSPSKRPVGGWVGVWVCVWVCVCVCVDFTYRSAAVSVRVYVCGCVRVCV